MSKEDFTKKYFSPQKVKSENKVFDDFSNSHRSIERVRRMQDVDESHMKVLNENLHVLHRRNLFFTNQSVQKQRLVEVSYSCKKFEEFSDNEMHQLDENGDQQNLNISQNSKRTNEAFLQDIDVILKNIIIDKQQQQIHQQYEKIGINFDIFLSQQKSSKSKNSTKNSIILSQKCKKITKNVQNSQQGKYLFSDQKTSNYFSGSNISRYSIGKQSINSKSKNDPLKSLINSNAKKNRVLKKQKLTFLPTQITQKNQHFCIHYSSPKQNKDFSIKKTNNMNQHIQNYQKQNNQFWDYVDIFNREDKRDKNNSQKLIQHQQQSICKDAEQKFSETEQKQENAEIIGFVTGLNQQCKLQIQNVKNLVRAKLLFESDEDDDNQQSKKNYIENVDDINLNKKIQNKSHKKQQNIQNSIDSQAYCKNQDMNCNNSNDKFLGFFAGGNNNQRIPIKNLQNLENAKKIFDSQDELLIKDNTQVGIIEVLDPCQNQLNDQKLKLDKYNWKTIKQIDNFGEKDLKIDAQQLIQNDENNFQKHQNLKLQNIQFDQLGFFAGGNKNKKVQINDMENLQKALKLIGQDNNDDNQLLDKTQSIKIVPFEKNSSQQNAIDNQQEQIGFFVDGNKNEQIGFFAGGNKNKKVQINDVKNLQNAQKIFDNIDDENMNQLKNINSMEQIGFFAGGNKNKKVEINNMKNLQNALKIFESQDDEYNKAQQNIQNQESSWKENININQEQVGFFMGGNKNKKVEVNAQNMDKIMKMFESSDEDQMHQEKESRQFSKFQNQENQIQQQDVKQKFYILSPKKINAKNEQSFIKKQHHTDLILKDQNALVKPNIEKRRFSEKCSENRSRITSGIGEINSILKFINEKMNRDIILRRKSDIFLKNLNIDFHNQLSQIDFEKALSITFTCDKCEIVLSKQDNIQKDDHEKTISQQLQSSYPLDDHQCVIKTCYDHDSNTPSSNFYSWIDVWKKFYNQYNKVCLIEKQWMMNNYQLVVWKLAGFQNCIKNDNIKSKKFTLANIVEELEIRIYKNLIQAKRSVLQKIMDHDENISRHMVLLVCKIEFYSAQQIYAIELSDGWTSVYAIVHNSNEQSKDTNNGLVLDLLRKKKIFAGQKIHVFNLQKSPIQIQECLDPKKMQCSLSYNGISRAFWHESLGLSRSRFFIKGIDSLKQNGKIVPMVDVFIIKKYPLIQVKNKSLHTVFKNEEDIITGEDNQFQKQIFFSILVLDAQEYFNQSKNPLNNLDPLKFCYIQLLNVNEQIYEEIKVGERIRFFSLQGIPNYDKNEYSKYENSKYENSKNDNLKQEKPKLENLKQEEQQLQKNDLQEKFQQFTNDKKQKLQNKLLTLVQANKGPPQYILMQDFVHDKEKIGSYRQFSAKVIQQVQQTTSQTNLIHFLNEYDANIKVDKVGDTVIQGSDSSDNVIIIKIHCKSFFLRNLQDLINKDINIQNLQLLESHIHNNKQSTQYLITTENSKIQIITKKHN